MEIPDTANNWVEKYNELSTERKFNYWKETLNSNFFEKLQEEIDFIDFILNYLGELEREKEQEKIIDFITSFLERGGEIDNFPDQDLSYLEKNLIHRKLFKNQEITIDDLKHFMWVNRPGALMI